MIPTTLIGYGEAGQAFDHLETFVAYDIVAARSKAASVKDAVAKAEQIISVVTADQALRAARTASEHIPANAFFFDMNSVAPDTKCAAAAIIDASGGRYIDVAIMSPVNPSRMATPLFVSGPYGEEGAKRLTAIGFTNVRVVGNQIGRASTIKMLRSVMYKGVEALTAECLIACERAGVTDEVLGSFGNDWSSGADYRLDRMMVHGLRRSEEMAEVVKTLEGLGVAPLLTRGTELWQREIGKLGIQSPPDGLNAKLGRLE